MNPSPSQSAPADAELPLPQKQGQWFLAVLPVLLIAACAELGISILNNSALPIYFKQGLHIDTFILGIVTVQFFLAEVLFKSPLGVLSDRYGRKPLMLGGALVTLFTPILLVNMRYHPAAATAGAALVGFGVLRALDGLGEAALWPSLYAYVADVVEEKKRGAAMGLLNLVYLVGIALSFLAGGFADDKIGPWLTQSATFGEKMHQLGHQINSGIHRAGHHFKDALHHPHLASAPPVPLLPPVPVVPLNYQPEYYYPSFYLASVLFGIAAIATLGLRSKVRARTETGEAGHDEKMTWEGFSSALRSVPQFLGLAFVTFLGIGCIMLLVKLFALQEFGLTETQFGVLALGPALIIAAIAVPAGYLADKWGKTRCVRLGFSLCALGLWGIPLLHHFHVGQAGFIGAASLLGIGFVLAFPAWLALLTSLGGETQRGTVFAAVSTAQGVGAGMGILLGTALYGHVSPIAPFIAAALLVSFGAILAMIFVRESILANRV